MNVNNKSRLGTVDLLKFIFAVGVMIHHSRNLPDAATDYWLRYGSIFVEPFFLFSGYFIMASAERLNKNGTDHVWRTTGKFLLGKAYPIFPYMLYAYCVAFVPYAVYGKLTVGGFFAEALKHLQEPLMLSMLSPSKPIILPHTWYISSMLLVMAVLFPFLYRYKRLFACVLASLGVLVSYGVLLKWNHGLLNPLAMTIFGPKGNIRAVGDLCLGVLCYFPAQRLSIVKLPKQGKWAVTLAQAVLYGSVVALAMKSEVCETETVAQAFVFAVAVTLTCSRQGVLAEHCTGDFYKKLGKISLLLYINHYYVSDTFRYFNISFGNYLLSLLCYMAVSAVATLLCYIVVDRLFLPLWHKIPWKTMCARRKA